MRLRNVIFLSVFACADIPSTGQKAVLATHVDDWRDEVIYQVIVDRFADGDLNNDYNVEPGFLGKYQGGDWRGLENRLPYLQDLGVTTLWISPIVKNVESDADVDGYHGYWSEDLHKLNPHFGDAASLRSLVNTAHTRGMKVVLDIVCNHMGQLFFYDMNLNGKPDQYIGGSGSTSPVTNENEYDPDWDPRGVQAYSAAGNAGRAPVIFLNMPEINRTAPTAGRGLDLLGTPRRVPRLRPHPRLQRSRAAHARRFSRRLEGRRDGAPRRARVHGRRVHELGRAVRPRRLPHRHGEARRARVLAVLHRGRALAARAAEQAQLPHVRRGVRRRRPAPRELHGARRARQRVLLLAALPGVPRRLRAGAHDVAGGHAANREPVERAKRRTTAPRRRTTASTSRRTKRSWASSTTTTSVASCSTPRAICPRSATRSRCSSPRTPSRASITERSRSSRAATIPRTARSSGRASTTRPARPSNTSRTSTRSARRTSRFDAAISTVVYSTQHTGQETDAGILAYERGGGDAPGTYALVVLNTNDNKSSSTGDVNAMPVTAPPGTVLVDILDPSQTTHTVAADGTLRMQVPAQSASILIPQDQVVPLN